MNDKKYESLLSLIRSKGSVVVAFSGGVDSSFLAAAAYAALGEHAAAVTAVSPVEPAHILEAARETAKQIGIRHIELPINPLQSDLFRSNPVDRCYHCKTIILGALLKWAHENGYQHVLEGSNLDDAGDYRPGMKAVSEKGASSPLKEVGYTKEEIRSASRRLQLSVWEQPSSPCLASRIPYGSDITLAAIKQIAETEKRLLELGFSPLRVRRHDKLARIEILQEQFSKALDLQKEITDICTEAGFTYVTLDLSGFRSGSLNADIKKTDDTH